MAYWFPRVLAQYCLECPHRRERAGLLAWFLQTRMRMYSCVLSRAAPLPGVLRTANGERTLRGRRGRRRQMVHQGNGVHVVVLRVRFKHAHMTSAFSCSFPKHIARIAPFLRVVPPGSRAAPFSRTRLARVTLRAGLRAFKQKVRGRRGGRGGADGRGQPGEGPGEGRAGRRPPRRGASGECTQEAYYEGLQPLGALLRSSTSPRSRCSLY